MFFSFFFIPLSSTKEHIDIYSVCRNITSLFKFPDYSNSIYLDLQTLFIQCAAVFVATVQIGSKTASRVPSQSVAAAATTAATTAAVALLVPIKCLMNQLTLNNKAWLYQTLIVFQKA